MRAFLSHASSDKDFVDKVASMLRPGTYELDALTFEKGEMSVNEIINALKRSELFCLFMSEAAGISKYVEFEQRLALELAGAGKISNFLTVCLDEASFDNLSKNTKLFNAVRKVTSPEAVAHLIKGKIISASKDNDRISHPFIGRENELNDLESQVLDFNRPKIKAFFVSGNAGVGRKSILENLISRQYPQVVKSFPRFEVESYAGYDEIFRQVTASLKPSMNFRDYAESATSFSEKPDAEKAKEIANLLNSIIPDNLICFATDAGGMLHESGALSPEMSEIVSHLNDHPHPPLVIVSPRMTPRPLRRPNKDIAYLSVTALSREDTLKLVSWAIKTSNAKCNEIQIEQLMEISDYHPYNVYEMKSIIQEIGVTAFLADTSKFIAWKHKETSAYFKNIKINDLDSKILSVLMFAPELDFGSLVHTLKVDSEEISHSVQSLVDLHVLSYSDDRFSISPPLRIAVERDPRVKLKENDRGEIVNRLASSLTISMEDGSAPIALADAVVLANLESGKIMPAVANALLLPSHRIWLAQRHYDAARWSDCLRLSQDAVKDKSRLSAQGLISGYRLLCLSASRLNEQDFFDGAIAKLTAAAKDSWSKAHVEFLRGFNFRMRGDIIEAEKSFKKSYDLNENDRSTARELASACLITGDNIGAERFARRAYELATNNPYTIDILVSALVKSLGPKCVNDREVNDLLDRLTSLDDEENKSFSHTRKAEIEFLYGSIDKALLSVKEAMRRTPHLFEPKLLNAKILLKQGRKSLVPDEISFLERFTSRTGRSDNKAHKRQVLILKSEYMVETAQFKEAREIFDDSRCFNELDREKHIKKIDIAEAIHSTKK